MSASGIAAVRRAELADAALRFAAANAIWDAEYERSKPQGVETFDERLKLIADLVHDAKNNLAEAALKLYAATVKEREPAAVEPPPTAPTPPTADELVPF